MKALRGIIHVFTYISMVATVAMLALTVADVVMRVFFQIPLSPSGAVSPAPSVLR